MRGDLVDACGRIALPATPYFAVLKNSETRRANISASVDAPVGHEFASGALCDKLRDGTCGFDNHWKKTAAELSMRCRFFTACCASLPLEGGAALTEAD